MLFGIAVSWNDLSKVYPASLRPEEQLRKSRALLTVHKTSKPSVRVTSGAPGVAHFCSHASHSHLEN